MISRTEVSVIQNLVAKMYDTSIKVHQPHKQERAGGKENQKRDKNRIFIKTLL